MLEGVGMWIVRLSQETGKVVTGKIRWPKARAVVMEMERKGAYFLETYFKLRNFKSFRSIFKRKNEK